MRVIRAQLFGIESTDIWTIAAAATFMAGIAIIATWLRRAGQPLPIRWRRREG